MQELVYRHNPRILGDYSRINEVISKTNTRIELEMKLPPTFVFYIKATDLDGSAILKFKGKITSSGEEYDMLDQIEISSDQQIVIEKKLVHTDYIIFELDTDSLNQGDISINITPVRKY